jgi:predicted Zn finger-like uncharacterized protein
MTCSCPKCHANIEVDLSRIPENGTFLPCSECKGRFWINRESYARRALVKEGQVYCDQCGKELDHKIVCAACGIMYPDYYLVQASKPPRRQVEKPDYFSMSFSLKPARQAAYSYTYAPEAGKSHVGKGSGFPMKRVGLVAIVAILAVALGFFYMKMQAEQKYAKDYMRALYTIKTGSDLSLKTCARISSDWKAKTDAGQNFVPRVSAEEESRLNKVKEVTDRYMQKLNKPPDKFVINNEKLANLYGVYTNAHTMAVAPSGSLQRFSESAAKSEKDFNAALAAIKGSMPPALSKELQIAKTKYRGLQNI